MKRRTGRPVARWLVLAGLILAALAAAPALGAEAGGGAAAEAFTVALTGKYPPFSFYDDKGELAGFDVDVSRAVARRLGRRLEIVATEWDGILAGLLAGKYDAIIGSMAITPERSKQVYFSEPYYISGAQLFVRSADREAIGGIGDCAGRALGVGLGETYEHWLRREHPEAKAAASLAIGFLLAIPLGIVLNHGRGAACRAARVGVDFVRGTPVLIQLFFVYFGAPQVGVVLSPIASAVLTLSVSAAA